MPVFLLAVYAKGEKLNLTAAEKTAMRKMVEELIREYQARRRNVFEFGGKSA